MNQEAAGVKVEVKYAKLVKWENDDEGIPIKTKPPLQILEKHGDDAPFMETFRRPDYAAD